MNSLSSPNLATSSGKRRPAWVASNAKAGPSDLRRALILLQRVWCNLLGLLCSCSSSGNEPPLSKVPGHYNDMQGTTSVNGPTLIWELHTAGISRQYPGGIGRGKKVGAGSEDRPLDNWMALDKNAPKGVLVLRTSGTKMEHHLQYESMGAFCETRFFLGLSPEVVSSEPY